MLDGKYINKDINSFYNILNKIINKYVLKFVNNKKSKYPSWFNTELKQCIFSKFSEIFKMFAFSLHR